MLSESSAVRDCSGQKAKRIKWRRYSLPLAIMESIRPNLSAAWLIQALISPEFPMSTTEPIACAP